MLLVYIHPTAVLCLRGTLITRAVCVQVYDWARSTFVMVQYVSIFQPKLKVTWVNPDYKVTSGVLLRAPHTNIPRCQCMLFFWTMKCGHSATSIRMIWVTALHSRYISQPDLVDGDNDHDKDGCFASRNHSPRTQKQRYWTPTSPLATPTHAVFCLCLTPSSNLPCSLPRSRYEHLSSTQLLPKATSRSLQLPQAQAVCHEYISHTGKIKVIDYLPPLAHQSFLSIMKWESNHFINSKINVETV
jgi:hypothetical protein